MRRVDIVLLVACCALASVVNGELVLSLDSKDWSMANENGTLSLKTHVPAYPLEVLRSQGVIQDPLYRYGEIESRWVAMESWTFSTTISAQEVAGLLEQQQVLLQLGGVDTYADVLINGEEVAYTTNFHRQWTFPVKSPLKAGQDNTLTIIIKSVFKTSLANKQSYPYHIPTLYNTGSIGAYNFARKPAFDFGWDWGPAFAASGIHGSVKLIAFSQPTLAGAYMAQSPVEDGFKLIVTSQFWVPAVDTKGFMTVSLPELELTQRQELAFSGSALSAHDLNKVEVKSELTVDAASVQLWWPAGGNYGPHKLYDVDISFTPAGVECNAATPIVKVMEPGSVDDGQVHLASAGAGAEDLRPPSQEQLAAFEAAEEKAEEDELFATDATEDIADAEEEKGSKLPAANRRQLLAQQAAHQIDPAAAFEPAADADAAVAAAAAEPAPAIEGTGSRVAAAALKGILGAISNTLRERQAGAGADQTAAAPVVGYSPQCSTLRKRIGFRTIELVMQPLPQAVQELFGSKQGFSFDVPQQKIRGILARDGAGQWANNAEGVWSHFPGDDVEVDGATPESFYFKVNGVPIYMKGANVIPLSVIPTNSTPELVMATLQAAVDSNQNMLRVWGGGLYHTEDFYNFADENGLLIWQDAMFGGSHYPRTKEWISDYAEEIAQQAQRLSWHPSVALWCGNNEVDLSYEWSNSTVLRSNRNMFAVDYQAVFIDTVRKNIKQVNPNTIFVDSSPFKGAVVDTPDLYLKRWGYIGDPRYGTIHSYNYMSDCEDFRSYPLGKFVSEFGWQSYPLPETYAAAMDPEKDWGVGNAMNEFRNRRSDVTPQFLQQYAKHFKLPQDWNPADVPERMKRFRSYLWIGNMQHMRCYETALNFWRRLRSNSQSLTMGVMYWQLNDIWAGASWSSIDVSGRWKPVHYAVKRAYAPLAVQAVLDHNEAQIFIVSDMVDTKKVTVSLRLVSLSDSPDTCRTDRRRGPSDKSVVETFNYDVPGLFATRVWKMSAAEVLKARPGCTATTCYLAVTAQAEGIETSESQLWFTQFKNMQLPDPKIVIDKVTLVSPVEVNIAVRSQRPAPLVMLSAAADRVGHFTDNGFNLDPCEPRTVTYISHNSIISKSDLQAAGLFSADSLFDHSSWVDAPAKQPAAAAPAGPGSSSSGSSSSGSSSGAGSKNGPVQ